MSGFFFFLFCLFLIFNFIYILSVFVFFSFFTLQDLCVYTMASLCSYGIPEWVSMWVSACISISCASSWTLFLLFVWFVLSQCIIVLAFLLHYILLLLYCSLFSIERGNRVDRHGCRCGEEMGEEWGENIIRIYYVRKTTFLLNNRKEITVTPQSLLFPECKVTFILMNVYILHSTSICQSFSLQFNFIIKSKINSILYVVFFFSKHKIWANCKGLGSLAVLNPLWFLNSLFM